MVQPQRVPDLVRQYRGAAAQRVFEVEIAHGPGVEVDVAAVFDRARIVSGRDHRPAFGYAGGVIGEATTVVGEVDVTAVEAVGGVSACALISDFSQPDVGDLLDRGHDRAGAFLFQRAEGLDAGETGARHGLDRERVCQLGRLVVGAAAVPVRHRRNGVVLGEQQRIDVRITGEVGVGGGWRCRRPPRVTAVGEQGQREAAHREQSCRSEGAACNPLDGFKIEGARARARHQHRLCRAEVALPGEGVGIDTAVVPEHGQSFAHGRRNVFCGQQGLAVGTPGTEGLGGQLLVVDAVEQQGTGRFRHGDPRTSSQQQGASPAWPVTALLSL